MRRILLLSLSLLCPTMSAEAGVYVAEIRGTVESTYDDWFTASNSSSPIRVGDTIVARFVYGLNDGQAPQTSVEMIGSNKATFELAGFTWSSAGDFLGELAPPTLAHGNDPMNGYVSTMDDAPGAGDLYVLGYSFDIGEFGYDFYRGPGFRGTFDRSSYSVTAANQARAAAVPEPAAWAMMIGGFGAVGTAFRARRAAVRKRQPVAC